MHVDDEANIDFRDLNLDQYDKIIGKHSETVLAYMKLHENIIPCEG